MKRLSIIVPVFNVERYLSKCLESLLAQDIPHNEYEIIIINDGSTDGSLSIAEKYVKLYPNLKLISQENNGLGAARNIGIIQAKGMYLIFVDSDDYIAENSLSLLLNRIESLNLDVLRFNHQEVDENYKIIPKKKNANHAIIFREDVIDGNVYLSERLGWGCYVWTYLFKTSFIREGKYFFESNIYFEDTEWLPPVLLNVKRMSSIDECAYNYLQRKGSITKASTAQKKKKVLDDKIYIIDRLIRISKDLESPKVILWFKGMITHTVISIIGFLAINLSEKELRDEVFLKLKSRELFPLVAYNFTAKQIMFTKLINISPLMFYYFKRFVLRVKNKI